jgi:hypothetical protein
MFNKERGHFLIGFIFVPIPKPFGRPNLRGISSTPRFGLGLWGRRSGRFPPEPCPPPSAIAFYLSAKPSRREKSAVSSSVACSIGGL